PTARPRPPSAPPRPGPARPRLAGRAPRRRAADRFAGSRAPAALPVAHTVLLLGGEVGVRRPVDVLHVLVGARPCVLVAHEHRDRRAERHTLAHTGRDPDAVLCLPRPPP